MRLSLEGIGAVLQSRDEYTIIREIVPGSPADKSGKLKVGDRIVGVAQGNGPYTDVLGWRLDDVVALVRGEKGSTVRLDVIPGDGGPDAKHVAVSMVRKKISMEEQAASTWTSKRAARATRISAALPATWPAFLASSRRTRWTTS